MTIINEGAGSYTTTLPQGETAVTDWQGNLLAPLVSPTFEGAIPSSDWASSLYFAQFGNPYSSILYAHPLALEATETGLNLGYTSAPVYYTYNDTVVKYEYSYHSDLRVSLDNLNADSTTLAEASDWAVTANWQNSHSNTALEATFGHGMPFVYFTKTGPEAAAITLTQHHSNTIGQPDPTTVESFTLSNLNGTYSGGEIGLNILTNGVGEDPIGNAAQARVSIDSNGDGNFDYVRSFNFIPLDADPSSTEVYTDTETRGIGNHTTGTLSDLTNATVKVEIWQAFGEGKVDLALGSQSYIDLPIETTPTLYLDRQNGSNQLSIQQPESQTITLGTNPDAITLPWAGDGSIWYQDSNVLGVTINGTHYGLFAPETSNWNTDNGIITSDLAGKDYFSVAVLPNATPDTLNYYHQHAYAFVTETTVNYQYDQQHSVVETTFDIITELKEAGFSNEVLTTLYRHQYIDSETPLTEYSYNTARGEMFVAETNNFTTTHNYTGILPALPNFLNATQTQALYTLVESTYQDIAARPITIPGLDTYWVGKEMAKFAEVAQVANQVGHTEARDFFIHAIKTELQDWFTVDSSVEGDKQFYYNEQWNTFQGYPASFHSETQINDHHFHYGYFVKAAATVAQYDPNWVQDWGGMVNLLIKDVANTDRTDSNYPFLRNFDPYAGHSWASGHGAFAAGNNHESSSEAMNFASATLAWGAQTGDQHLVDLGAYLYATENAAINQYWFDIDQEVFPTDFDHSAVGMVWGDGGSYSTWFSGEPEMIHGINFLPMSGASLYLGQNAQYVAENYQEIITNNGGSPNQWMDIILQYQAFYDPQGALEQYNLLGQYNSEEGETALHTYHWVNNFNALGHVETSISADSPFYAVFNKNGELTYTAYNPTAEAMTITFSDGTVIELNGEEFVATNSTTTWSSVTGLISQPPAEEPPAQEPPAEEPPAEEPPAQEPPAEEPPAEEPPAEEPASDMTGTSNNDTLVGTVENDTLAGLAGHDTLHGQAGDDTLFGNTGDDTLHGNDGDDTLLGGDGKDYLYGNTGHDRLSGGKGADFLVGGAGANTYYYTEFSDSVKGAQDLIESFNVGQDKFDFSSLPLHYTDLTIIQENGFTYINSNPDNFSIKLLSHYEFTEADFIFDGSTAPHEPPFEEPSTEAPAENPTLPAEPPSSINVIQGTDSPEQLTGTAAADIIYGGLGSDQVHGNLGKDYLYGEQGQDYLHGNEDNDILYGGQGNDFLYGNAGDDYLHGGQGGDYLVGGSGHNTYAYTNLTDSTTADADLIETFLTGDKIDLSALSISTEAISTEFTQGYVEVSIANTDFLLRVGGVSELTSADFTVHADSSTTPEPPEPPAEEAPPTQEDPLAGGEFNGTTADDTIHGGLADEQINASAGNDTVHGLAGNDRLNGGDGNDTLHGNTGHDTLNGEAGDDHLYGNEGQDTLTGGAGADFLVGGAGADIYTYTTLNDSTLSTQDTIEGFVSGEDVLDLTQLGLTYDDITLTNDSGTIQLSVPETNFSIEFIATATITTEDIQL